MLRKSLALLLSIITVLSLTACEKKTYIEAPAEIVLSEIELLSSKESAPSGTPLPIPTEVPKVTSDPTPSEMPEFPEYPMETVKLSELSGYTIVYPSAYSEYRMNEIYLLRDTITDVLGIELEIKSDAEDVSGNKIIIASSVALNGAEGAISLFQSGLDYVIGTLDGNIILGGNNFYADMRAIYDFINNYLGWDDIENIKLAEPKEEISGVNLDIYQEPEFVLLACSYSVSAFTEQYAVRDMAEAHFNMAQIEGGYYSREQFVDFIKWCARYEIRIAFRGAYNLMVENADCPIIVSGIVRDEPPVSLYLQCSKDAENFLEQYGKYGWYPYVNYFGYTGFWRALIELAGLFDTVPFVSFDQYFGDALGNPLDRLTVFEDARELARRKGQNWYNYIESYNIINRGQNSDKMLRWSAYIAACFDVDGIMYFQYGDASPNYTAEGDWSYGSLVNWDFTKNEAWYHAKETNEELIKLYSIYSDMDYVGAAVLNDLRNKEILWLEDEYPYVNEYISDIKYETAKKDKYILGLFDDDGKKGMTMVNLSDLDDEGYDESTPKNIKIKLNGDNATFYFKGEPVELEKDSDGYYTLNMANGYCWFITFE